MRFIISPPSLAPSIVHIPQLGVFALGKIGSFLALKLKCLAKHFPLLLCISRSRTQIHPVQILTWRKEWPDSRVDRERCHKEKGRKKGRVRRDLGCRATGRRSRTPRDGTAPLANAEGTLPIEGKSRSVSVATFLVARRRLLRTHVMTN